MYSIYVLTPWKGKSQTGQNCLNFYTLRSSNSRNRHRGSIIHRRISQCLLTLLSSLFILVTSSTQRLKCSEWLSEEIPRIMTSRECPGYDTVRIGILNMIWRTPILVISHLYIIGERTRHGTRFPSSSHSVQYWWRGRETRIFSHFPRYRCNSQWKRQENSTVSSWQRGTRRNAGDHGAKWWEQHKRLMYVGIRRTCTIALQLKAIAVVLGFRS